MSFILAAKLDVALDTLLSNVEDAEESKAFAELATLERYELILLVTILADATALDALDRAELALDKMTAALDCALDKVLSFAANDTVFELIAFDRLARFELFDVIVLDKLVRLDAFDEIRLPSDVIAELFDVIVLDRLDIVPDKLLIAELFNFSALDKLDIVPLRLDIAVLFETIVADSELIALDTMLELLRKALDALVMTDELTAMSLSTSAIALDKTAFSDVSNCSCHSSDIISTQLEPFQR
jgi:hypothetical protein